MNITGFITLIALCVLILSYIPVIDENSLHRRFLSARLYSAMSLYGSYMLFLADRETKDPINLPEIEA